ncbi:MAG: hypothetical protein KC910_30280 [Candidatus Eremiobacteraeota bacterium]|nr:hypothetical protein [Candidatus Eremiobacteraeota bacterium]
MSELDKELSERAGGRPESSGEFTLDPAQARLKMARYQLESPHHFALSLVASVVAGGATRIEVAQDADDFELVANCQPLDRDALEQLFHSQPNRQLHELAIATNGALALEPVGLTIESGGHRLRASEALRVEECPNQGPFRFHLKTTAPLLKKLYTPATELVASHLISERCGLAPVEELGVRGRLARLAVQLGPCRCYGIVQGKFRIGLVNGSDGQRFQLEASQSHSAVLSYQESGQPPSLTVILDGVSFMASVDLGPKIRAIVWTTGLTKDLSQANLVRDEHWEALLEWLQERARELLAHLPAPPAEAPAGRCPSCGQTQLVEGCPVQSQAGPVQVKVGSQLRPLLAGVCQQCGHVSFNASMTEGL